MNTFLIAALTVEMINAHVAHVRWQTNESFTVVERPSVVTNADLRVEVTGDGVKFSLADGTVLATQTGTATFSMTDGEQFYGLGLVLGKPLSYRGQTRTLYNSRAAFEGGAMTDMAVPLVVSSRGYGIFTDNTYRQDWDFTGTNWTVKLAGGAVDYYFIADNVLDRYTQLTGRAPIPPRWAFGYIQSKFGYRNWDEVFAARDAFRSNDLPIDALVLDLYWFGQSTDVGTLRWNTNAFPNPAANIAKLGLKLINISEPYINRDSSRARPNLDEATARHFLAGPSVQHNGLFGTLSYFDFLNPAARRWWFEKMRPWINDGVAAHWTDLGEPEEDDPNDVLYGGRSEAEIHNVYSLLWHRAIAEGYATNYPNTRLFMLSRSGFAGDQRFGAAHWSNDVEGNWPTLAAHPVALCNYGMSGMSYFSSDIGGFTGHPSDELYIRWFQFGAFCPVFRAHGVDKPVAPYEFSPLVRDNCRAMLKLRYRMLPYIYNAARETYETGTPMCRYFGGDGSEYMFGPDILVAPVTTEGATSRSVYLPAGKWIDHWSGRQLTGPVTTNWPAPLAQIPLFYRDNSIIPFGPAVASSQLDDGSKRGLRIYCSSTAHVSLYDDDGASNGYRSNEFARTAIVAMRTNNAVTIRIGRPYGTYAGQPDQRAWEIAVFNGADGWVRTELPAAPFDQPRMVTVPLHPQ